MKKNRYILVQHGLFFLIVFMIMAAAVGIMTYLGSVLEILDNERGTAYNGAYDAAEIIMATDDYPSVLKYWTEHPEEASELPECIEIRDKLVLLDKMLKVTLTGPVLIGIRNDGENIVLVDTDTDRLRTGDEVGYFETGMVFAGNKEDIAEASKDIVFIEQDDGDIITGVGYPIIEGEKTLAIAVVSVSDELIDIISLARTGRTVAAVVITALFSGAILMVNMYRGMIRPIQKIQKGVLEYTEDHDTDAFVAKMEKIRLKNELGRLTDSISVMAHRISRYSDEKAVLSAEKAKRDAEMEVAAKIQMALLPVNFPDRRYEKRFDIFAVMNPARQIGGDMYDFFFTDDDHLALLIADVSEKGVPAALFMMESKTMIRDKADSGKTPAQILNEVNSALMEYNNEGMFITAWLLIIELSTGEALEANAGHCSPVLCHEGGKYEIVENKHSIALAMFEDADIEEYRWKLRRGDRIFVYTDGVTEATDSEMKMFETDRLLDALNEVSDRDQTEILEHVKKRVDDFAGDSLQYDDLTMLGFTYMGDV